MRMLPGLIYDIAMMKMKRTSLHRSERKFFFRRGSDLNSQIKKHPNKESITKNEELEFDNIPNIGKKVFHNYLVDDRD